jgi:leader peptidase (prepilin peptidase)/N-methyltransferase
MLAAITLTDLDRRVIPNRILLAGAIAALVVAAVLDPSSLPERAIAAAAAGGVLLVIGLAYPQGMGMGDVKLAAVMGLYLGSSVAPALLVGVFSGAVVGLGMMLARGSEARKLALPFGPFLALGGVVGLLVGDQMIDWYLNAFVR